MSSLFERIGGSEGVAAAVPLFYRRVLADPLLAPVFAAVPMARLQGHQQRFLSVAFGGPNEYQGRSLAKAHAGLVQRFGLDDRHFDAVVEHLAETLRALGVGAPLVVEVAQIANSVRADVLGRPAC